MRVRVRLHNSSWEGMIGGPVRWTPGSHDLELPDGATVQTVLEALAVPEHLVALVAVNRRAAEADTPLADGDLVEVIPPVTGG
jgi:molybdopterin converting factor small subunit